MKSWMKDAIKERRAKMNKGGLVRAEEMEDEPKRSIVELNDDSNGPEGEMLSRALADEDDEESYAMGGEVEMPAETMHEPEEAPPKSMLSEEARQALMDRKKRRTFKK